MTKQFEAKFTTKIFNSSFFTAEKCAHGEKTCGEAIADFEVGTTQPRGEHAKVEAFHLDELTDHRQARAKQQWTFIGDVGAHVPARGIVLIGVEQFERAAPVVVPAAGDMVFVEVGVV